MNGKRKIELLAPAKDFDTARAAIDYGADAVYMGAPRFGARQAAGNPVSAIADAAAYAHLFGARVYVTLNTILFEDELRDAEVTARQVIEAGADALIVQDMAYAEMGLEGIELHASTQTFNATPEKAKFLQDAGFTRVILERNLSIEQIRAIRSATEVELECFVHGAICVCHSGRCYMSRSMSSRSGNRGDCIQACRMTYDLTDEDGTVLRKGKHLLSVKDMDLSARIGELMDAGISSFKIEGRLKDTAYVKNVVSWYRRRIDEELQLRKELVRSSAGESVTDFVPDITKTFSRGRTEYFYCGRRAGVSSPDTPKAVGAAAGRITKTGNGWIETDSRDVFSPGDGICCISGGMLSGTNINRVEGRRLYTNKPLPVSPGDTLFRNYDHRFATMLEASRTRRVIDVSAEVFHTEESLEVRFSDTDGNAAVASVRCTDGEARDTAKMAETLRTQLSRSGDTVFRIADVKIEGYDDRTSDTDANLTAETDVERLPFIRVSALNALRREGLEKLARIRTAATPPRHIPRPRPGNTYPYGDVSPYENVTNSMAARFYKRYGAKNIADGLDLRTDMKGVTVMRTPFCIRRENGMCMKISGTIAKPLFLLHGRHRYRLEFDCRECMMSIIYEG